MRLGSFCSIISKVPLARNRPHHVEISSLGQCSLFKKLTSHTGHHFSRPKFSSIAEVPKEIAVLEGKLDRHKGIHVYVGRQDTKLTTEEFQQRLQVSLAAWREAGHYAAWLKFPIMMSSLIPTAAENGFVFHHAERDSSTLYCWLSEQLTDRVPMFASHQVGVAACVLREDSGEVLMVQDKNRPYTLWKFPGGISELGEDISSTAERELLEETGVQADFQGIITFRQQHSMPNAFGRSDLFFICHLRPRTFDLHPDFENEIAQCQWMGLQQVLQNPDTSSFTHNICALLQYGLQHGFDEVHLGSREMESVYKGLKFTMFYPPVASKLKL